MFGARIQIMWEEQLVDPPIDYIGKSINDAYQISLDFLETANNQDKSFLTLGDQYRVQSAEKLQ